MVVGWVVAASVPLMTLVTLTALGAHRRGMTILPAVLAGVFFPVTWTVWYIRDEHPYRRAA